MSTVLRNMSYGSRLPPAVLWLGVLPASVMLIIAIVGPTLLTVDPNKQALIAAYGPPSRAYLLGADQLGRSVAARLVAGARVSLGAALAGVVASVATGALLGLVSAVWGGWPRTIVMRLADVFIACPTLLFVVLVSGLLGGGLVPVFCGLWLAQWPGFARVADTAARRELASDHVESSRVLGFSRWYVMRRHIFPGVAPYLYSLAALTLGTNVLAISSVGFLGIGLRPPLAEWGAMIAEAMTFARMAPHMVLAPAAAILICTFSATLIGEYLGARQQQLADPSGP